MHDGQNYSSASAYFSATPPHGVGLRGLRGPNRMCPWRGRVQLATPGQTRSMHDGQNYSSANAYFLATPPHGGGLRPVRGTRQNSACFLAAPPHRGGLRGPWSEPDVSIAGKTSKFRCVLFGHAAARGWSAWSSWSEPGVPMAGKGAACDARPTALHA